MEKQNDTDAIKKLGNSMMSGFSKPKSAEVSESKEKESMFEMPSFGGEDKPQSKQGCSCGHDAPQKQPQPDNMFGNFGNLGSESPKEQPKPKSADEMFGGGFGGMGSSDDADKLKELGKRMMGQ